MKQGPRSADDRRFKLVPVDFDPFAQTASVPLTEAQREMWTVVQMGFEASSSYNQLLAVRLRGPLALDALQVAVEQLVARHEALRLRFEPDASGQTVMPATAVEVHVTDLTTVAPGIREQELQRMLRFNSEEPFDLIDPPLMRARIFREGPDTHTIALTAHHIVCDGWSGFLLLRDLGALYEAERFGLSAALPAVGRYTDYARRRSAAASPETLDYWRKQLAGPLPTLDLPTDKQRPPIKTYNGAIQRRVVAGDLVVGLRRMGARHGSTLYTVLLAAWQVLLYRLSAQDEVVVGVPIADRDSEEERELVGHCTNLLPLRGHVDPAMLFTEHLQQTRRSLLDAQEHQRATFGTLVRLLNVPRDPSRTPLVAVTFNVDKVSPKPFFESVTPEWLTPPRSFVNWELEVNVVESQHEILIECAHNSDLFDEETVRRWLEHYTILLTAVVEDPARPIFRLPVLSAREERQLAEWGRASEQSPDWVPVHRLFEAAAARRPGAIAAVEGRQVTYGDLNRRANRLAHRLIELGVRPDVLVGLCVDRSLEMIVGILGILKAGGAYLPLDPSYPKNRLALMLEDARTPVVVTQARTAGLLPASEMTVVVLEGFEAETAGTMGDTNPTPPINANDLAYVIYTSGSTGRPKGVQVTHLNVARLMTATDAWFHFGPDDVWTLFHSYAFDFSVWEIWGALAYGGRLVVVPYEVSRSPKAFADLVRRERVTVLNQTPSAFRELAVAEAASGTPADLALRLVIFGGEALDLQSLRPWFARHGDLRPQLVNMYGITETTVHVTYRPITIADVESGSGSVIGRPLPDLMVRVLDQYMQPVPTGVPGELYVGGAGVARGYLQRPELTAERFVSDSAGGGTPERLYRSGDLVRYLANGDLEYLGRIDQQVKIRGFRIELGEIEAALFEQPGVQEAVVVARDFGDGDRRLVAYVVPAENCSPDALRAALGGRLPDYMVPSIFVGLARLPRTANDKVDREALPAPASTPRDMVIHPRTPVEEVLARIFCDLLSIGAVGIHDDFFRLGGHSLLATRLLSRVLEVTGVELKLRDVFSGPTIEHLAMLTEDRQVGAGVVCDRATTASQNASVRRDLDGISGTIRQREIVNSETG